MSLWTRFFTVVRANLNALIGKAEDPQKLVEQALEDMRKEFTHAKGAVTAAIADEKKLLAQLQREKTLADEWEEKAMLAVRQNRDDLATQALARQTEHQKSGQQLHEAWTRHKADTEKLRSSLRAMNDKLEELKRKKSVLLARHTRARAAEHIQDTLSSMGGSDASDTFQRMEDKIEGLEHKVAAEAELARDLRGDTLEQEFRALASPSASSDQRLAALKQKMQLGAGVSHKQLVRRESVIDAEGVVVSSGEVNRSK